MSLTLVAFIFSKTPFPINDQCPNYERGEYYAVQRLVKHFPDGLQIKQEASLSMHFLPDYLMGISLY